MQDTTIISLFQKYINNQCSEQELKELLRWLKSSDDHSYVECVTDSLWRKIDKEIAYPNPARTDQLKTEVGLLLEKIRQKENKKRPFMQRIRIGSFSRIAALFILLLSATLAILYTTGKEEPRESLFTEKIVQKGMRDSLLLADGTKVILNSDTKLRIPADFNEDERWVEMTGEGFFDVAHNPDKPFHIKSGEASVQVLGTSFDFKSYAEDDFIKLTVSTGKVRFLFESQDIQLAVSPNEHLSVNKKGGNIKKEAIQENNYTKWMKGSLYFEREPLTEVIKTINRMYNQQVVLQCTHCERLISGTHDNKSIEAVVEAVCFTTGLRSRREGNNIIIYE